MNLSIPATATPSATVLAREARCVKICEILAEKVIMRGLVDIRIVDDVRLYLSIYQGTTDMWSALESNIKRECHYDYRPIFCECMLVVFGQESRRDLIKAMEMTVDLFPVVKGFVIVAWKPGYLESVPRCTELKPVVVMHMPREQRKDVVADIIPRHRIKELHNFYTEVSEDEGCK